MKNLLFAIIIIIVLPIQSFGAWTTGITNEGNLYYAATVNDSGNLLGEYCSPDTGDCIWILGIASACKEGDQYPVLGNSDVGSAHITVYCSAKLDNGLYRYVFSKFDDINDLIIKGLKVGFAIPLQADQFRVIRFDLGDSNRAINAMNAAVVEQTKKKVTPKTSGTKDELL